MPARKYHLTDRELVTCDEIRIDGRAAGYLILKETPSELVIVDLVTSERRTVSAQAFYNALQPYNWQRERGFDWTAEDEAQAGVIH